METPAVSENQYPKAPKKHFGALYSALVLLSLHWALVLYINSSFLSQFVEATTIGILYTTSAVVTIASFLYISRILHRTGNLSIILGLTLLEFGALMGMAITESAFWAVGLFLVHQAIVPLMLFNLDIYMETLTGDEESSTGSRRGLFLAVMSVAGAVAPLVAGFLIHDELTPEFGLAYIISALFLIPFAYIIVRYFRAFKDPAYTSLQIVPTIRQFWQHSDIRNVFGAHFLLQLFFAWMVIYTPIYLAEYVGFRWEEIGLILFVGLMAYVILEYPIGIIADAWLGEKEMMIFGFIVLGASVSAFTFTESNALLFWMFLMFMTRVGASFVETTTESYFFKHTKGSDANLISFFRITRPLSYLVGALAASVTLLYLPFDMLFVVLGLLMIFGFIFSTLITDTK